jgi:DNA helicase-2/ATP-dependent DNA helicase PcrA
MLERINKLEYDLELMKSMSPFAAINYIRKGIGYEDYLTEYAAFRRIKAEELFDTLNELQDSAREYKTYEEWFYHISEYQEELKKQAQNQKQNKNSVALITMHGSKGLEYRAVFIVDANEGITPHRKALLEADMEEERRLFYVAVTRAKEYLHIYSVKERYNKELACSRFVGELLLNEEQLKAGTKIVHKTYGEGIIKANNQGKLIIYFEEQKRERALDLGYCIQNMLLEIKG